MNVEKLQVALKRKASALYQARHPSKGVVIDIPNFEQSAERIKNLQRRLQQHSTDMKTRRKLTTRRDDIMKRIAETKDGLKNGALFVCYDVERNLKQITEEIGITVLQGGEMRTRNIRIDSKPRYKDCDYCETENMTLPDAVKALVAELEPADFVVGHSMHYDYDHLSDQGFIIPKRRRLDTFYLTQLLYDEGQSLAALCEDFGVDAPNPHVGGNDSYYTMEVLLKTIEKYA